MSSFVAKKVAKHILKENAENRYGTDDPYFEYVAATDMNGKATGKTIKRKKPVPPGLNKNEEKILKKVTRRAYRLDNCFNFCGVRIGWSTIIGIIPALGDVFDVLMAMMVMYTCTKADIPHTLKSRMTFNIALDFVIGLVPVLGDVGDAFFRANTKNAALLYEHLRERGEKRINGDEKSSGRRQKKSSPQEPISEQPGRTTDRMEITEGLTSPASTAKSPAHNNKVNSPSEPSRFATAADVLKPSKSKLQKDKSSRGWFGGSRSQPEPDLENGDAVNRR